MKKFIFSIFFLLGLFVTDTISAQTTETKTLYSNISAGTNFRTANQVYQGVKAMLPTLYTELSDLEGQPVAQKLKHFEIMLYKKYASDLSEGIPAFSAYKANLDEFDANYSAIDPTAEEAKLQILNEFNNLTLN